MRKSSITSTGYASARERKSEGSAVPRPASRAAQSTLRPPGTRHRVIEGSATSSSSTITKSSANPGSSRPRRSRTILPPRCGGHGDESSQRVTNRPLNAAQTFHDAHGHLDVPTDHLDSAGFDLGRFITAIRDAYNADHLDPDFTAELEALGMIWDKHQAAWRARLTAATDYHRAHGHLAAPSTTPMWETRCPQTRRPTTFRPYEHPSPPA
ncbi:helicase associated domain-containing protein [Streptomyces sp. NBC_01341]|uniref:helicase associated domain-containing protein n=1 Tax=Streptomyces sp. NBC_01341 TaxID=2903831 RepID=UPI002E142728|nr:helicase associated domain-containing protein [Streptomyces sp. NBC_01341]